MSYIKYTKEILEPLVKQSTSIAQVMRLLGLSEQGGNHTHLSRRIKYFGIDTSHITGQRWARGTISNKRLSYNKILILRTSGSRQKARLLVRALLEINREYKCVECGIHNTYNNKKIVLEVDHINENWLDDRPENLQFLCPNCHSQKKNG